MDLESTVEQRFVKAVLAAGGVLWKTRAIGKRGFFDRVAVLPGGRVWFVELKRPKGGRVSPHQSEHMRDALDRGANAIFIKTEQEVEQWLTRALSET